jgi:tellurite resistance protein TehA-like permease
MSIRHWCRHRIATLYPGYFALVMATGIIANGMLFEGQRAVSDGLFAINVAAYCVLLAMTLARAVRFPRALWNDLTEPRLVFSFFTLVAATDVVGVGLSLRGFHDLALALWVGAFVAWLLLIYLGFAVLIVLNAPARADIIFGGWLIAIVATQAVAIHGLVIAPHLGAAAPTAVLFAHMLWGVGVMLYLIFIVLFAGRVFLADVRPDDITPALWVVMGAAAITTNAGTLLIGADPALPFVLAMRPFVDGMTTIMWAWATWWIPLLVVFGVWTHGVHRRPLTYTPLFWSLVFPLGMYALASLRLSQVAGITALAALSRVMEWIALGAWLFASFGLAGVFWRHLRSYDGGATAGSGSRA